MHQAVIDYDPIAREYGAHRRPHPGILEVLIALVDEHRNSRVLEIGVGTGNFANAISATGRARLVGIDPSREMLSQVPGERGIARVQARAECIPIVDQSIEIAYSVDVIHHIRDRDAAAAEAFRVLRPSGTLAIATDSEEDIPRRVPLSSHFPETVAAEQARYPTIGTIRNECERAGFVEIEERHVVFRYDLTNIQPYRDKAFSSLHLISNGTFERGLSRMERELTAGPIKAASYYTIVLAKRPGS